MSGCQVGPRLRPPYPVRGRQAKRKEVASRKYEWPRGADVCRRQTHLSADAALKKESHRPHPHCCLGPAAAHDQNTHWRVGHRLFSPFLRVLFLLSPSLAAGRGAGRRHTQKAKAERERARTKGERERERERASQRWGGSSLPPSLLPPPRRALPPRLPTRSGAGGTTSTSRPSGRTRPSSPSPPPTPSSPPSHWYALPSPPLPSLPLWGRGDYCLISAAIRRLVPRLLQKPNLFCPVAALRPSASRWGSKRHLAAFRFGHGNSIGSSPLLPLSCPPPTCRFSSSGSSAGCQSSDGPRRRSSTSWTSSSMGVINHLFFTYL